MPVNTHQIVPPLSGEDLQRVNTYWLNNRVGDLSQSALIELLIKNQAHNPATGFTKNPIGVLACSLELRTRNDDQEQANQFARDRER